MALTRRQFLGGCAGLGLTGLAGASYTHWGEPHWFELTHVPVRTGRPGEPVRLLHVSDLHASEAVPLEMIAHALDLGLGEKPDAIVVTGDFFTTTFADQANYVAILRKLSTAAPTFACFGNHDGGDWARYASGYRSVQEVENLTREAGIVALTNASRELSVRGRPVQFIGTGDYWSRMCEPERAFRELPSASATLRIVLNHNPDAKTLFRPFAWDLMCCGHTHGGQLRLPFLGTPFAPVKDKRYVAGLKPWENRWIYTTRGIGNLHGLRFNCRPEVTLLEIS